MRFGLMSLLVFIFWKLFDRKSAKPSNWVFILAILISTLLFAIGHYGATASMTEMTRIHLVPNDSPKWFTRLVLWLDLLEAQSRTCHACTYVYSYCHEFTNVDFLLVYVKISKKDVTLLISKKVTSFY